MSQMVQFNSCHINLSGTKTKIVLWIMAKFNINMNLIFIPTDYCYFIHYVDVLRILEVIGCSDKSLKLIKYLNLDKWILSVDGKKNVLDFKCRRISVINCY